MTQYQVMSKMEDVQQWLKSAHVHELMTPPNVIGGQCITHHRRMIEWEPKLQGIVGVGGRRIRFDPAEFIAAVHLHSLEHVKMLKEYIKLVGIRQFLLSFLSASPFDYEAAERIVDTIAQHRKPKDDPADSDLLQALRIADKLDRFSTFQLLTGPVDRAGVPWYDEQNPWFSTGGPMTYYTGIFRVLEWPAMMPSDECRALINVRRLRQLIEGIRKVAEEIAEDLNIPNLVEDDLRKAFGVYYETLAGKSQRDDWWVVA